MPESPFTDEVGVLDFDRIRVILEFNEIAGSWSGTEKTYTSLDKKTLYQEQGTSQGEGTLRLSRALDAGAETLHIELVATNASPNAVVAEISKTSGDDGGSFVPATEGEPLRFTFVEGGPIEQSFFVRIKDGTTARDGTKHGTAEGTTTITATPLAIDARSDSENFLDQTDEVKHVRFDNDNVFNVARGGFTVSEGSELAVSLNNNRPNEGTGTAVVAPSGQKYTVKALGFSATTTLPVAIGGSDYLLVPAGVEVEGLDPATPITGLAEFPADDFINGSRKTSLNGISIEPTNRGASVGSARNFLVTIRDETPAASVAVHTTAAYPTLPAAAGVNNADLTSNLNNGNPVIEGEQQLFYLLLEKAHRANIYSSNRKPVQVRIAPLSGGLTRAGYEIKLGDPTQSNVEGGVEGVEVVAGGGSDTSGYIVRIDRKDTTEATSTSETIIPLLISLKKDDTTDAAATHTFGIVGHAATGTKALGPLTCGTSDVNWWQPTTLPTTKTYGSSHGCYQQAAIGQTPWRVALKSAAEPSVSATTTNEVKEGNASSTGNEPGEFIITFAEGQFITQQNLAIKFYKSVKASDGTVTTTDLTLGDSNSNANVKLKPVGTENTATTNGVSISGSTLTINANTAPPVRAAFSVNLDQANNDGGLTSIFMEVDKPEGLGKVGNGLEEDETDPNNVKLKANVGVRDADLNRVKVEFVSSGFDATPTWGYDDDVGGVSAVYHSADKQSVYEHQGTTNPNQTFRVVLDRPWTHATDLSVVVGVGGAGSNLNIGTTSAPTTQTDITLTFASTGNSGAGDQEKTFYVKSRLTRADEDAATTGNQNTASGFIETTITANPTVDAALADEIADINATANYFRMDNDNILSIKHTADTVAERDNDVSKRTVDYEVIEGDKLSITTASEGASVTAPTGEFYRPTFQITANSGRGPRAVYNALHARNVDVGPLTPQFSTLGPDMQLADVVQTFNGPYIDGTRYFTIQQMTIAPVNRGALGRVNATQKPITVAIKDNEPAAYMALSIRDGGYPSAQAGTTLAERATVKIQNVEESDSKFYPFDLNLSVAHRLNHGVSVTIEPVGNRTRRLHPRRLRDHQPRVG